MGVLLVGLMYIGALLPAGRYEILQGVKSDYATCVARSAFRDIKARGYLNPTMWRDMGGANVAMIPPTPVVIDPLAPTSFGAAFPSGASLPLALRRIQPFGNVAWSVGQTVADPVFRCQDDTTIAPDTRGKDRPPFQQTIPFNNQPWVTPPAPPVKRSSEGNYSWLATIVPDPQASTAIGSKMIVSVAVIYKRNLAPPSATGPAGEAIATVNSMLGAGIAGGEIELNLSSGTPTALSKFPNGVRPGQWIMLAGTLPSPTFNYFRWYRVVAAAPVDTAALTQQVTLAGTDWNTATLSGPNPTTAFLFDNVIGVVEKNLELEIE